MYRLKWGAIPGPHPVINQQTIVVEPEEHWRRPRERRYVATPPPTLSPPRGPASPTPTVVGSRIGIIASIAAGTVLLAVFIYLVLSSNHLQQARHGGVNGTSIADCIEKFRSGTDVKDVQALSVLNGFCYNYVGYQLAADEEVIKRDNYLFQRNENVVLMYMVVLITFAGVLLAGVQLVASYKLASLGKGELVGGGEIHYSTTGASFKSSVVGLVILALSFAFFLVFVLYIYTFDPEQRAMDAPSSPSSVLNIGRVASPQQARPSYVDPGRNSNTRIVLPQQILE